MASLVAGVSLISGAMLSVSWIREYSVQMIAIAAVVVGASILAGWVAQVRWTRPERPAHMGRLIPLWVLATALGAVVVSAGALLLGAVLVVASVVAAIAVATPWSPGDRWLGVRSVVAVSVAVAVSTTVLQNLNGGEPILSYLFGMGASLGLLGALALWLARVPLPSLKSLGRLVARNHAGAEDKETA